MCRRLDHSPNFHELDSTTIATKQSSTNKHKYRKKQKNSLHLHLPTTMHLRQPTQPLHTLNFSYRVVVMHWQEPRYNHCYLHYDTIEKALLEQDHAMVTMKNKHESLAKIEIKIQSNNATSSSAPSDKTFNFKTQLANDKRSISG
jgi:hypothetical protein